MTRQGLDIVLNAAREVQAKNPEVLAPLAEFFGIDIDERLENSNYLEGLAFGY